MIALAALVVCVCVLGGLAVGRRSRNVGHHAPLFAFALHDFPHRPDGDPRDDLDLASFGIVSMLDGRPGDTYPGLPWEPKAAFSALAESYR
jgi:hypothetical protein